MLGESFEDCLIREVKEETALDVSIERMLGMHSMFSEPYLQALYACRLRVFQAVQLRADEHVEHRWVTLAEMEGMEVEVMVVVMMAVEETSKHIVERAEGEAGG